MGLLQPRTPAETAFVDSQITTTLLHFFVLGVVCRGFKVMARTPRPRSRLSRPLAETGQGAFRPFQALSGP